MEDDSSRSVPAVIEQCTRRRLAENAIVAVDLCSCGVMQLHLGALTLRMSPGAVSELVGTLGQAVEQYAREQRCEAETLDVLPTAQGRPRGQA